MHIAVEGCSHGCLTDIYATVQKAEQEKGMKVDLLLLCGDFQALRNSCDYDSIAVPPKFRSLGSFHEYYSGQRTAPCLTIVIGGNHECMAYMWELYHGGWLAPNIYYLGHAGSVIVNGIRISGASGIYKSHDFHKGHFERVPYDRSTVRSAYHTRKYDIHRLSHLTPRATSDENNDQVDIFLSHDWPIGVTRFGDEKTLLRKKQFFTEEVRTNTLGSPPLLQLLQQLHPTYWFSAHLHVKFAAVIPLDKLKELEKATVQGGSSNHQTHPSGPSKIELAPNPDEIVMNDINSDEEMDLPTAKAQNPDEIAMDDMDDSDEEGEGEISVPESAEGPAGTAQAAPAALESVDRIEADPATKNVEVTIKADEAGITEAIENAMDQSDDAKSTGKAIETRFLALDKCGTNKQFIQFLEIPTPVSDSPPRLQFDPEWLAITRAFHPWLTLTPNQRPLPSVEEGKRLIAEARVWIDENVVKREMPAPAPINPPQSEAVADEPDTAEGVTAESKDDGAQETASAVPIEPFGPLDVDAVQIFAPTAPPEFFGPAFPGQYFTNRQTEDLCRLLGVPNLVNPLPPSTAA